MENGFSNCRVAPSFFGQLEIDGVAALAAAGHGDDFGLRVGAVQFRDDFNALLDGHAQVSEDQIGQQCGELVQAFLPVGCGGHGVTGGTQHSGQEGSEIPVVVDDQNGFHGEVIKPAGT